MQPDDNQAPPLALDAARKGPWGPWATLGWGVLIGVGWTGAQILGAILFVIIVMVQTGGATPDSKALEMDGRLLAIATCFSAPAGVGLSVMFAWMRKGPSVREYLGLVWPGKRIILRWCIWLLLFVAVSDTLTSLLGRPIVPDFMTEVYQSAGWALPLLWIALVIGAPFGEEFMFRGFLFTGLSESRVGPYGAMAITSAIWAVIHMQYDFYGIATLFVGGIFLGWARWKTGSLWLCVLLHALMNLIATIQAEWLLRGG